MDAEKNPTRSSTRSAKSLADAVGGWDGANLKIGIMTYHEFEKEVYKWLLDLRSVNKELNFSVREGGRKTEYGDIFVGTERSNYFGTTFWNTPTGFRKFIGVFSLVFHIQDGRLWYKLEVYHTSEISDDYSTMLRFIIQQFQEIEHQLKDRINLSKPRKSGLPILTIKGQNNFYDNIDKLLTDLTEDLPRFIDLVDKVISKTKAAFPEFEGRRITASEFTIAKKNMEERVKVFYQDKKSLSLISEKERDMSDTVPKNIALNQILYGPPGTGKTYRTITDAVKIANPFFGELESDRKAWTEEYQRLVKAGRIVFTTFHQSLSYEDFVEGLKPKLDQGTEGDVIYEIKAGIFRKLCIEAAYAIYQLQQSPTEKPTLDYGDRFEAYLAHVQEVIDDEKTIKLLTKAGRGAEIVGITDRGNIQIKHDNGERIYTVSKDRQVRLDEGIEDFDNLEGNIYTLFASIIGGSNASMHWAVMNAVRNFTPPAVPETKVIPTLGAKAKAVRNMTPEQYDHPQAPAHVLIIDEINRGNVSRIFGEIITLLEPDKRLGQKEALTVTLPYSRDEFGVPPNLYLIGTMNTADRSVVALDSALRRRFRFVEVPPDPEVLTENGRESSVEVGGKRFDLVDIMTAINDRVEFLRDRDHLIGHSYFLKMEDEEGVAREFATGIVPLLREYFYEDYGQLQLILGGGFITSKVGEKVSFPDLKAVKDLELNAYQRYTVEDYRGRPGALRSALSKLLNIKEAKPAEDE